MRPKNFYSLSSSTNLGLKTLHCSSSSLVLSFFLPGPPPCPSSFSRVSIPLSFFCSCGTSIHRLSVVSSPLFLSLSFIGPSRLGQLTKGKEQAARPPASSTEGPRHVMASLVSHRHRRHSPPRSLHSSSLQGRGGGGPAAAAGGGRGGREAAPRASTDDSSPTGASSSSSCFPSGGYLYGEKRVQEEACSSSRPRKVEGEENSWKKTHDHRHPPSQVLTFLARRLLWTPSAGPLALNCRRHPHYIKILKDGLSAVYTARGDYTDVGVVQADRPLATDCSLYYFEVHVLHCASSSPRICVGLTTKSACLTKQPGIEPNSIGYRSEDGRKLSPASGSSSLVSRGGGSPVGEAFGASYGCGDMIGCGVHHLSRSLFFTKNGVFVGVAGKLDPQVEYYPSVGMHATDEKVKFNFTGPFAFDLQKMLQFEMLQERQEMHADTASMVSGYTTAGGGGAGGGGGVFAPSSSADGEANSGALVSKEILGEVVRSYLLRAAFSRTLEVFDREVKERGRGGGGGGSGRTGGGEEEEEKGRSGCGDEEMTSGEKQRKTDEAKRHKSPKKGGGGDGRTGGARGSRGRKEGGGGEEEEMPLAGPRGQGEEEERARGRRTGRTRREEEEEEASTSTSPTAPTSLSTQLPHPQDFSSQSNVSSSSSPSGPLPSPPPPPPHTTPSRPPLTISFFRSSSSSFSALTGGSSSAHLQSAPGLAEAFQTAEEEDKEGEAKDQDVHMTEVCSESHTGGKERERGGGGSAANQQHAKRGGEGEDLEKKDKARDLLLRVTSSDTAAILQSSLAKRKELRQAIVDGDAEKASSILEKDFPLVLRVNESDNSFALALLYTQQIIDYLRPPQRRVLKAVKWMKEKLSVLMEDAPPHIRQAVMECCGLLAYEEPEKSSLHPLFDLNRRAVTATAINRCVLRTHLKVSCWSPLEILVRHLVACRQLVRESCGSRGPIPSSSLFCYPPPLRLLLNPSLTNTSPDNSSTPAWSVLSSFTDESVDLPLIYNP